MLTLKHLVSKKQSKTKNSANSTLKRNNSLLHDQIFPIFRGSILHPLHSSSYCFLDIVLDVPQHTRHWLPRHMGRQYWGHPLPRRLHTLSYPLAYSLNAGRASLFCMTWPLTSWSLPVLLALTQPHSHLAAALRESTPLHTSWTSQLWNTFRAASFQH